MSLSVELYIYFNFSVLVTIDISIARNNRKIAHKILIILSKNNRVNSFSQADEFRVDNN